jgi:Fuc2NAc and GlcNAc transferase
MHDALLYVLTLWISFLLTWYVKRWAIKHVMIDIPNERSSHSSPTLCFGVISIVMAFYAGLFYIYFKGHLEQDLFFALLPGLGLALVGIFDDLRDLSPSVRFIIQFICSGVALYFLGGFHSLFGDSFGWFWSFTALIGFVWFINLFNFLDGSDGYASMEAISITLALWIFSGTSVFLLLVFSVGGFLYWNWPRAKIFMGDAGSTTLGFILVVLGIHLHNSGSLNFLFWIMLTALFWFDASVTLLRRILNKERLSHAHKNHIFQRAIQGGFSHLKTMLIGLCLNIVSFMVCFAVWEKYCSFLTGLLLILIILWLVMKYVDKRFAFVKHAER